MAIIKGFVLQVVDSSNAVIANLGSCVFPALQWLSNMGTTQINIDTDNYTYFSPYTPDYALIGNSVSDYFSLDPVSPLDPTIPFSRFYVLAPLTLRKESIQYAGYKLRLAGNDSGYYAISNGKISSQGMVSGTWNLYDADGNLLGTQDSSIGFPLCDSVGVRCYMPHNISNGVVTSTVASILTINFGNSSTHYASARIYGTTPSTAFVIWFNALTQPTEPSDDPYSPGGTTGPGGGTGTHDPYSSDHIGFNMLPEVSAVGTGFLSLWSPTEQQMLDLSEYMWNANPLTLDFWRRLIADPIQLIYGLNIIPLSLQDAGLIGGTESVVVGMINTGIKMDYLTSQWVELDCGTIDIEETWGAYLDYDPYTKLDIYLPYIGYRPLRVDDFMPGVIHVKYKIDLLTGACCAQILSTKSNEHDDTLDSVIYQFTGNCATQIPVTATQYADAVRSAISLAAAIGTVGLLAGAGASAAGATGAAGAAIMPGVDPVGLLNPPGLVPVESELFGTMSQYNFMTAASDTGAVLKSAGGTLKNVGMIHAGASAVENVMGIKPSVQRSGAIGGAAGMLGTQTPYLIFTRPRQAVPENQSKYTGYPSFMTKRLSELTGFTQIQAIHLESIPCTANELAEIDALLKSGVIF